MRRGSMLVGVLACLAAGDAAAQLPTAAATLVDAEGRQIGTVRLQETPIKGVLLRIEVTGLAAGEHGIHIHETGRCDAPSFESAGGHFNPWNHDHGAEHPNGMHGGDLMNLGVPGAGRIEAERLAREVTLAEGLLNSLFDADGSALVIHAGPDDYQSQPSGSSGSRVACGVIRR